MPALGRWQKFVKVPLERQLNMIDLNIKSLVDLTYRFLLPMRERKQGAIINVASTAGFQPVPFMATYAATKSFVLCFSEALWEENRPHGVHIMALCQAQRKQTFSKPHMVTSRRAASPRRRKRWWRRHSAAWPAAKAIVSGWMNFFMVESGE
jgi:short-subunit dehydrogenase